MPRSLIGLGSNLGDRRALLECACAQLATSGAGRVEACSQFFETPPAGGPRDQSNFLNSVAVLDTALEPQQLLEILQTIERNSGRIRDVRWGPRSLDLDLLLYEDRVLATERLVVPHPRLAFRRFVLEPAAEIAGSWRHPQIGWSIAQLLAHLRQATPYVAITGAPGAGKTELARRVVDATNCRWIEDPLDPPLLEAFYGDPAGHAWATEIEFLTKRQELLRRDAWADPQRWTVSDFWFDQSPAFASVWLPPEQQAAYHQRWQVARAEVQSPKLLVVLDVPEATLRERIVRRGRAYEQGLDTATLGRLRGAIAEQAVRPELGPVLWLADATIDLWLDEVLAALEAMQPDTKIA